MIDIFTTVHTGEIEDALGKIGNIGNKALGRKHKAYVEDKKLRKDVIEYLNSIQLKGVEPKIVYEPKNQYRHLDENSGITSEELTCLYTIETPDGFGIIWENIDLTDDRATVVFKCSKNDREEQINKIATCIVTLAQFRSTIRKPKLDNPDDNEKLKIFKSNLGVIGSIQKQRGKNESSENWVNKLDKLLLISAPNIPNRTDLEKIEYWTPGIVHHTIKGINSSFNITKIKKPKQIDPNTIESSSIFENEGYNAPPLGKFDKILEALIEFNKKLQEI